MKLSIVIPVYNSDRSITEVVYRLVAVLEVRAAPFEIILVNDGSRDRSWDIVSRLTQERPEVLGIDPSTLYRKLSKYDTGVKSADAE